MHTTQTNNNQNGVSHIGTTSSVDTEDNNDFILANTSKSRPNWVRRRIRSACSKKTLYKRIPILGWVPQYNQKYALSDFIAGVTIGCTVIAQGLVFAMVAGVPPQYGLYTSFMGCFVYGVFGTCKASAVGPSIMTAVLIFEAIGGKGPQYGILLCFLTGLIQLLLAVLGFGFLIDFISTPVMSGFACAGAVFTATTQIHNLFGMKAPNRNFIPTWVDFITNISQTNFKIWDTVLGLTCLLVLVLLKVLEKILVPLGKLPKLFTAICIAGNLIVIITTTIISYYVGENEETPFRLTGYVPSGLPTIQVPPFSYQTVSNATTTFREMVADLHLAIFVVPFMGLLETITVCKTFNEDVLSVDATQEFLAIGLSNVMGSFLQALPCSAALGRSAINYSSGVKTTLGGLYTGVLVLLALVYLTPYFYYIPKATLASVIIAACTSVLKVEVVKQMWRTKKSDLIPGLTTFVVCLTWSLQYGILMGVGVDLLSIMYHAARPKIYMQQTKSSKGTKYLLVTPDRWIIFPSVYYVKNLVTKWSVRHGVPVVLDCSHIYGADYTAATVIRNLIQDFVKRHQPLLFYNLRPSVSYIVSSLSVKDFFVYYNLDEFDDVLKTWCANKESVRGQKNQLY
ncbi:hypothetical protein Zmor_022996 [Zophobas morio]|uniref:Sodium-independent sulfate anion transporter n=1 Tax=Zophobas morio TaxID=2755281 RepID=A0AA38HX17_9CUCU|nr:hypothetical protein Zmor_022996 [Zophobas morio]